MAEPEVTFMFSEGAEPSPFGNSRRKEKKKKKKGGGLAGCFGVHTSYCLLSPFLMRCLCFCFCTGYKSATEGNVTASDIAQADVRTSNRIVVGRNF